MSDLTTEPAAIAPEAAWRSALGVRSIVLIGMMGAGKSSVGRRLAAVTGLAFRDADTEIETAAGMSIPDIFAAHGEAAFRSGEQRVIARLLEGGPQVLATGGGAFMRPETRAAIAAYGVSVWLRAEFEVLLRRLRRRNDRPMLKTDDPAATLRSLLDARNPTYAKADITVDSHDVPHGAVVDDVVRALERHLGMDHATMASEPRHG